MLLEAIMVSDYKASVEKFNKEEVTKGSVVFLGDSIIKYFDTAKFCKDNNIINRGIAGDTSKGVLERLDEIIKIAPSVVVLNIGSNDIVRTNDSVDTIVKRILQIKYLLLENVKGIKVYILTLPPVLRDHEITQKDYMMHRNNDIIEEINSNLEIFTDLIDVSSMLRDSMGNLKLEYTTDGLHLTELGYTIFSDEISKEISK